MQAAGRASSPIHAPNQWPRQRPSFDAALRVYVDHMLGVGRCLMRGASTASPLRFQALSALRRSLTSRPIPSCPQHDAKSIEPAKLLTIMSCRYRPHLTVLRYQSPQQSSLKCWLTAGISLGLGLDDCFFEDNRAGDPYWCMRIIHYPPLPAAEDTSLPADGEIERSTQLSCGEHTDYGAPLNLLSARYTAQSHRCAS